MKPRVISTFSGCGGASMGYHLAGYDVLLACEIDQHAVDTYKLNFPDTEVYHGDIHDLTGEEIFKLTGLKKGELELFDGSPPCQGFSMSGKREFCDPKNQLYHEYIRLLRELEPKTFVMENVRGLVQGKMKLIFKDILTQLKQSGYDVQVKLMNAMYYNCATNRERVIFIGVRKDLGIPASHPNPQTKPTTVRECLGDYRSPNAHESNKGQYIRDNIHLLKPGQNMGKIHPKGSYFSCHKIDLDKPCPTILRAGYGLVMMPDNLTMEPEEAALLQSFPPDFKWTGTPSKQWERIGNSVPPNLMRAIAEHVKTEILQKTEEKIEK